VLNNALVLLGRLDQLSSFPDVVRERLFDVDVLSRLAGPDGTQGVPMIRGREAHDVDLFVVEHAAHVAVPLGAPAVLGFVLGQPLVQHVQVDITHGRNLDPLQGSEACQVVPAATVHADDGYADGAVGAGAQSPFPKHRKAQGRPCAINDKLSAVYSSHGDLSSLWNPSYGRLKNGDRLPFSHFRLVGCRIGF
jgi:hypothetical protein